MLARFKIMKKRPKVLLIDDDESFLRINKKLLEIKYGWACDTAASGEEAIALLKAIAELPDVVVVDMEMRGMHARDVLKTIREGWNNLPLLVLSGSWNSREMEEILKEGVQDFLNKPIEPDDLVSVLERVVSG